MSETATILVVDDLPANRDLMARRLERSGFRVVSAASGPEALELLRRTPVDLVLLDIMMPGMTGLDVLKTVRMTRTTATLPVVMVTAKTDSEDVVEALAPATWYFVATALSDEGESEFSNVIAMHVM